MGDSVAVNGACLTVAQLTPAGFAADLLGDTQRQTTLGGLLPGASVNLEPAIRAGERFGGHFVQGHVDGTARLRSRRQMEDANWRLEFELPDWLKGDVIDRGSIAVDGVSLTIQELEPEFFAVSIIPTTYRETTLGELQTGGLVNIEADLLIKAVRRVVERTASSKWSLDLETLKKMGYGA